MKVRTVQTASHWGVYNVQTDEHGNIVGSTPYARDPSPSAIQRSLPEMVRSEMRIDQPYVREGYLRRRGDSRNERGAERFVAVSWDQALDLIAQEIVRVRGTFGSDAIYGGSYGWASAGRLHHAPSVLKRFLGLTGGYVDKLGNHSFGAAMHIMPYVIGRGDIPMQAMPWSLITQHSQLVVMFGGAHLKNAQVGSGGVTLHDGPGWYAKARAAGVKFVNVSPSRRDGEAVAAEWLPIRPNSDVALMMGLAHTLVAEKLHDTDFLARYCVGYATFERYLLGLSDGVPKSADWAAALTGIDADTIRSLAHRMARQRTLVSTSWSVQRAHHGEQPVWMTVVLAAMLGQIGLPGGGYSFGLGSISGVGSSRPRDVPKPTLPLGPNAVRTHVPVGRVGDMLLNPGACIEYNGRTARFPDIKLIYSAGGNPFHHNTNLNRFVQAWRRPDTVIVNEPWWGPPAKFADIVLPATTTLERNDIQATDLSRFYIAMYKVIDPVGQSRNDFDIFAELSSRLGFHDAFTEGRDEMGWLAHMYGAARQLAAKRGYQLPAFEQFWRDGQVEFPEPGEDEAFLAAFRADPETNKLKTPSGKIEIYSQTVEAFAYDDCRGHPMWLEPAEWLGSRDAQAFPIHLISNQPSARLHSQLDCSPLSKATKLGGRERIYLNVSDAAARQLSDGDVVRVFNARGAFLAAVQVDEGLRAGVAQIATGAWYDPESSNDDSPLEKHGNPNVVTDDRGSSKLGQQPAAQTVLVQMEKYNAAPPAVTAFEKPTFRLS